MVIVDTLIQSERVISYDAKIAPCPFCGSEIQALTGIQISDIPPNQKWTWDLKCPTCKMTTGIRNSEQEVIAAWKRRYKKDDVEEDGYTTWRACLDRYVGEVVSRLAGADRADGSSAGDTGADPV